MSDTSSSLPVCIHCGTPRPADESLCPTCNKPWIDVRVASTPPPVVAAAAPPVAAAAAAAAVPSPESGLPPHDTGEFGMDEWTLPPEPPKRRTAMWLIPLILLLGVGGFWAYVAFGPGSTTTTTTIAAVETTTTTVAETTTTTTPPETTTTTAPTTTTTLPYPPASSWPPVGDPVDQSDLGLAASGVGEVAFGTPIAEAAGIFTSSLGESELAGNDDVCQSGDLYWLQWGPLRALFDGFGEDATFTAYRYEEAGGTADVNLTTLSGVALGDTVETLTDVYTSYTVTFEVIEGQDHFRLADGAELLLWGPVTSTDPDGIIEGIYSPTLCEES